MKCRGFRFSLASASFGQRDTLAEIAFSPSLHTAYCASCTNRANSCNSTVFRSEMAQ